MATDVWFLSQEAQRTATRSHRKAIRDICADRGWGYQPREVILTTCTEGPSRGRKLPLLDSAVAAGLYNRIHEARVAVVVAGTDPMVPLHPLKQFAANSRRYVQLHRYVRYKSFWVRVPLSDPDNKSWVGSFESWQTTVGCDGDRDPRCLPFHVFYGDGRGLDELAGRTAFDTRHGGGASRIDDRSAEWKLNPHDFHGGGPLHIAGFPLRVGCHWDVTATNYTISTPRGAWRVDGHVNVHPNAHVRGNRPQVRPEADRK